MFIDIAYSKQGNKTYRRVLLRNSYRVNGKVCHDTIANLSSASDQEIEAIKFALKCKGKLSTIVDTSTIQTKQGLGVGAVWVLHKLAKRTGISGALGNSFYAKLALWLVISCIINQGSRLASVRLASRHNACDILGLDGFDENDLYKAMDFLADNQQDIEQKLFKSHYKSKPNFYLYDVTSSYFEGDQNELADYGYNRDKKKGKKQIVIGLMSDDRGRPIAIEVFKGNNQDSSTVSSQIKKMAERFGVEKVTLVGDRGMIKQSQMAELNEQEFNYITAITKPQVESLIKQGVIQLSLFDKEVVEVTQGEIRYVLRRNQVRADEIEKTRMAKFAVLQKLIAQKNLYLQEHKRAKPEVALKAVASKASRLKIAKWLVIKQEDRVIEAVIDKQALKEESKLDGCYVLKTDLRKDHISKEEVHDRYKDLAMVEKNFRSMKTTLLEMRAIYVRKAERTRAHVFVIMLGLLVVQELQEAWRDLEITVEEGIAELASICAIELEIPGKMTVQTIPEPREMGKLLLKNLGVTLPDAIPCRNIAVATKKQLATERK